MVTVVKEPGAKDLKRSQQGLSGKSDTSSAPRAPDSSCENYGNVPSLAPNVAPDVPTSSIKSTSVRAREKKTTSRASGGPTFTADLVVNVTGTTSTNPPQRNSTTLATDSSGPQNTGRLSPTLKPRAAEIFTSNRNSTPQSMGCNSNLTIGDRLLNNAAYEGTEELEILDVASLEEVFRARLSLAEANVASDGGRNGILGDRKIAFKPGAGTDMGHDVPHDMTPPPATPQSPMGGIASTGTPPKPSPSILSPLVLDPSQDTSTNDSFVREAIAMVTAHADLCSPEAAAEMQAAARRAGEAVNTMEKSLYELEQHLEKFDTEAHSGSEPLAPQLKLLREEYRRTKICSLDLAIKIANYSRRFPEIMIPRCLDTLIPLSERKEAIKDYINEASNFATASEDVAAQWTHTQDKFRKLTEIFSDWEVPEEKAKLDDLAYFRETLLNLEAQMESSSRTAKTMNLLLTGATLTAIAATSICMWRFGKTPGDLVKLLRIHGENRHLQTLFGLQNSFMYRILSTTIAEAKQKPQKTRDSLEQTQTNIDQTENKIRNVRVQRDQLIELGSQEATTFSEVIVLCSKIWARTRNDAIDLKEYLEAGARSINRPAFLRSELDKARGVYILMASYLRQYADAITIG